MTRKKSPGWPIIRQGPKPGDAILASIVASIEIALEQHARHWILNTDETSWKSLNHNHRKNDNRMIPLRSTEKNQSHASSMIPSASR
jgi:hypothetical protein